MASVKSQVFCAGRKLKFQNLILNQSIDWHHQFRIEIESEELEGTNNISIDNSIKLIGEIVEVSVKSTMNLEGNGLEFKGIITAVNIDRSHGTDNLIVLSGYSPTYMLEDGIACKSFEEKTGASIVKEIVSDFPSNELPLKTDPSFKDKLPYIVQYKESNYQFLSRLAAMHGEWLYYNGVEFVYGKLQSKEDFDIALGRDLQGYDYGVTAKPSKFTMLAYDYTKNSQLESNSKSYAPQWLDNYAKKSRSISDKKFVGNHLNPSYYDIKSESSLKKYTEIKKASILADMVRFNGSSSNPSIAIGAKVGAQTNRGEIIDRFRITSVTHTLNSVNDYYNSFEAIPLSTTAPFVNKRVFKPEAESNFAVVTDNEDPDGLGRVRVQFNWQKGTQKTPWIRVVGTHASKERGFYFTPEIEDEVIVDFEQGNPDRPYVSGTVYHGKAKPEWSNKDNNLKAIKTRSGHSIILNDKDGKEKIEIFDAKDNIITFDTSKETITISSVKKMIFESKDIEIKASNNINIQAGKNIEIDAKSKISESANNVSIAAKSKLDMKGDMGVKMASNMKTEISGKTGAKVSSDVKTEIAGTMLDLKASTMANLKGALVKIN